QVQDEFALADAHRVAGVVAALIARDDLKMRRKDIDYFAFAFVAPLSADHDDVLHNPNLLPSAVQANPETGYRSRFHVWWRAGLGERTELQAHGSGDRRAPVAGCD